MLESRIGINLIPISDNANPSSIYHQPFGTSIDEDDEILPYRDDFTTLKTDKVNDRYLEDLDDLIGAQVSLPGNDGIPLLTSVKRRKLDHKGQPIGVPSRTPIIDSRIYELEFPDGRVEEYLVNVIIENMLNQVASNNWDASMLDEIISIKMGYEAINRGPDAFVEINGLKRPIITTKGWSVQVKWKDSSMSWLPLSLVKSSNPVNLTEYVEANNLSSEPAFNWWMKQTLKKRDKIINKFKTKSNKTKIKFGINVPQTVEEAFELDKENGNTLWQQAIAKEMNNSRSTFQVLDINEEPPIGYTEITCHLIFMLRWT